MSNFAAYALPSEDLEEMREKIESLLGIELDARESEHFGGDYYGGPAPFGGHFVRVFRNRVIPEGGPENMDFSEDRVMIWIDDSPRFEEDHRLLAGENGIGAVLLKRKEWNTDEPDEEEDDALADFVIDE